MKITRYNDLFIIEDMFSSEECESLMDSVDFSAQEKGIDLPDNDEEDAIEGTFYFYETQNIIIDRFKEFMAKIYVDYNIPMPDLCITEETRLVKYSKGDYAKQHGDNPMYNGRRADFTFNIILNDDYEGGELIFPQLKAPPIKKKGTALFWPATFLYPHTVLPVASGNRFSLPLQIAYWYEDNPMGIRITE